MEESTSAQGFISSMHGTWLWWTNLISKWAGGVFHSVCAGMESLLESNTSESQEGLCQYSKGMFTVSVKYRTKIQTAFSPLCDSPSASSVWIPVKNPSLEEESQNTLRVASNFCSCNAGRWCWPCLSTWWPCLPRDTQSSALLSSLEGWHEFKPSWQPPILILLHKTLVPPKGFTQAGAVSWWFFRKAGHEGWETPQFAKHFGSKGQRSCSPFPWQP